uniref:Tropomyosin n=1 Tax=Mesocestoides corti TaxID=53468 RepID=A0A5K3ER94_MESCO
MGGTSSPPENEGDSLQTRTVIQKSRSSHRTIEDLNGALKELESKHRAEAARWKKKLEVAISDLEKELVAEREAKEAALKAGQETEDNYNQLAAEFDDLSHELEETRSSLRSF